MTQNGGGHTWPLRFSASLISREGEMSCKSCQSENQRSLNGEIAIHFPGIKGLEKPIVECFPKLLVCLNCGFTEFAVFEAELRRLAESDAAGA